ncbi:MAG: hypothetical protein IKX33_03745 [Prevotella sp.]|nr:hypothetical protein [Prevotella sp.]
MILQDADLSQQTIALFGCGDCESYSDGVVNARPCLNEKRANLLEKA